MAGDGEEMKSHVTLGLYISGEGVWTFSLRQEIKKILSKREK